MSKKNAEEEQKKKSKQELHTLTHKKIEYISSKTNINQREVYKLIKEFFQELLGLNYEFSHEELIEELKKTFMTREQYEKVVIFLRKIGQIEFTKKEFTQEELKYILREMHTILDQLIHKDERKQGFVQELKEFFFKQETPLERLDKEVIHDEQEVERELHNHHKKHELELQQLLKEIKVQMESGNNTSAAKKYSKALHHYDSLHEMQQEKYYEVLKKIYEILNKVV